MKERFGFAALMLVLGFILTQFLNCSPAEFTIIQNGGRNPVTNTDVTLRVAKPSMAIRGISCTMCHIQAHSNIITDFGYGDPQFFGNQFAQNIHGDPQTSNFNPLTLPWYGNYYGAWQLADEIRGTVIVPRVSLNDPRLLFSVNQVNPVSLAQIMQSDLGPNHYLDAPHTGAGPMLSKVTPASGRPKVQEVSSIYIGAPTESDILSLAPSLSAATEGWQTIGAQSSVSGLVVQPGVGGNYVTVSGTVLDCRGDVVIKGTLLLSNVYIRTDDDGCRLMVSKSVFINGQIRYVTLNNVQDPLGHQNLQISSARAILLGFSNASLAYRMSNWYRDSQPLTRGPGTTTQKKQAILDDGLVLGSTIHDSGEAAHCPSTMVTYTAQVGTGSSTITQCAINYTRLLLNAPNIQSRYVGIMSGVVISEIALFAPGALRFQYDTTFDFVNVLPLVSTKVLDIRL